MDPNNAWLHVELSCRKRMPKRRPRAAQHVRQEVTELKYLHYNSVKVIQSNPGGMNFNEILNVVCRPPFVV